MIAIPKVTKADIGLGNIEHLPSWDSIPDGFKDFSNKYNMFVNMWFFNGMSEVKYESLIPKDGVDKNDAMAAIMSILASYEPKHEHKSAGAAYLLSEWFTIKEE
jgi:hypothetical protein